MLNIQSGNDGFLRQSPAKELPKKNYSLEADIITGWIPKLKCIGPVPLNFDNPVTDFIIKTIQPEKIYYLGHRPLTTFKMHNKLSHNSYPFKYEYLYNNNFVHLEAFYRKFYSCFQPKTQFKFLGMNPELKHPEVVFDAEFESGNLDAVIKVKQNQYDLFIRIDSNTKGHLQWYYFKIRNKLTKYVKINIVNFKRNKTLYFRGMKPYIKTKGGKWVQGGENINFKQTPLRYQFLGDQFDQIKYYYKQLSFQLYFNTFDQQIQVAYCEPYTYGRMWELTKTLKTITASKNCYKRQILCESLGGLEIPLLTITDLSKSYKQKKCIFLIARQHPGQANSSHLLEGFLNQLCSDTKQAIKLRNSYVFKVVPMVNPDGVVMGNYRTSLCGRDLNRLYKAEYDPMYPEVQKLKEQIIKTKKQFKDNFFLFFDLHGHSTRRNVFVYGPDCGVWQDNYYKIKVLPKILSLRTEMFRYYSCSFRVGNGKKTTARAIFSKYANCYTMQASNSAYFSQQQKRDVFFDHQKWTKMGQQFAISLFIYHEYMNCQSKLQKEKMLLRLQNKRQMYLNFENQIRKTPKNGLRTSAQFVYAKLEKKTNFKQLTQKKDSSIDQHLQRHESDGQSSQKDDSEDEGEDLTEDEKKKFEKKVSKFMVQFEGLFFNFNKKVSVKEVKIKKIVRQVRSRNTHKPKQIELISCLKKRNYLNTSQANSQSNSKLISHKQSSYIGFKSPLASNNQAYQQSKFKQQLSTQYTKSTLRHFKTELTEEIQKMQVKPTLKELHPKYIIKRVKKQHSSFIQQPQRQIKLQRTEKCILNFPEDLMLQSGKIK